MLYLLDTNTFSDLMDDHPKVKARLSNVSASDRVITSPIVRGEILYGILRMAAGRKRARLESAATQLFLVAPSGPIPSDVGDRYAEIKTNCQSRGLSVDENDLWIAASAIALGAVLVSRDTDFKNISGLMIEDWTA